MSTAQDIINDALQRIGVYAPGETVSDADSERCLSILNDMLDSWSNESLTTYVITEQSVALTSGKQTYTIGTTGSPDINATRPIRIIDGPGAAYIQDTNGNNYGVDVVSRDQWNLIGNRSTLVTSNVPTTLWYDPQFPLGRLNFFPIPNINWTAFWDSYLQLTSFANLSSTLSLPPGYKDALQKCLATEIWPDFKDGMPTPWLVQLANTAKGNVKRSNLRSNVAVYDAEIVSHAQSTYNIYEDRGGGLSG